jgi:hypothetical protein
LPVPLFLCVPSRSGPVFQVGERDFTRLYLQIREMVNAV